ncbi:hypothetical protein [Dactylosporangium sp. CA-092794]|uniref:hypothetical protein n=1 Tax=Dactylosporangium sp. CA-092794 TaxID=3239929 RepID=UPI003D93C4A7
MITETYVRLGRADRRLRPTGATFAPVGRADPGLASMIACAPPMATDAQPAPAAG